MSTDFQTFLTAYPNPQDPPEAILSTVLQAILNKYPQMTGGTLSGEFASSFMGIPLSTGGGTVTVVIGTYSPVTVLSRTGSTVNSAKAASAAKTAQPR